MNRDILRLSIPNIISNITVPMLSLVDLALMGHLISELYIGAIALGGVIFNFIYWGFGFLRMSTSGFAAQAFGGDNKPGVLHTANPIEVGIKTQVNETALQISYYFIFSNLL